MDTTIPQAESLPIPVSLPTPTPVEAPASGFWGFLSSFTGGITFVVILVLVFLILLIIILGRAIGVVKDAPQQAKETFTSERNPPCNTDESHAIFPAI